MKRLDGGVGGGQRSTRTRRQVCLTTSQVMKRTIRRTRTSLRTRLSTRVHQRQRKKTAGVISKQRAWRERKTSGERWGQASPILYRCGVQISCCLRLLLVVPHSHCTPAAPTSTQPVIVLLIPTG
ncbi:uncharacterized protein LOC123503863 isoform X2 [Portunus trituberculatus]|uniref:uncharacterized protein LOC123503863 isoform X2 n=1 Tax=Portunus trituberculatus TaxID=210409 RepID=UPI001E1D1104|nr:uncharacterized protein LOC123503863 isoform X2 [Portunus trituberculatus]